MSKPKQKGLCKACLQAEIDIEHLEKKLSEAEDVANREANLRAAIEIGHESLSDQLAAAQRERDAYKAEFARALACVDEVFQLGIDYTPPILPDYSWAGQDKFEEVKRLARDYKSAIARLAAAEALLKEAVECWLDEGWNALGEDFPEVTIPKRWFIEAAKAGGHDGRPASST